LSESSARKLEVRRAYDSQVLTYEKRRFSGLGGELFDRLEKSHVLHWLKKRRVLQIGTATGRFTELLPHSGYEYYGIEIAQEMARFAKVRLGIQGSEVVAEVIQGDGESLPFDRSCFDDVLSVRSFHFLPRPRVFVREALRILVPGGRLVVSFEVLSRMALLLQNLGVMPRGTPTRTYYTIESIVRLFREEGLVILWSGKVTKMPLNGYWKVPRRVIGFIKKFHQSAPDWFGTVGSVIGEKPPERI